MIKKEIPKFKTAAEEKEFWLSHDSTEYIDWSLAQNVVFPNLKPSTETISLRLPKDLLDQIKILANKRDVPYQSLMKILLTEQVKREQLYNSQSGMLQNQLKPKYSVREPHADYLASATAKSTKSVVVKSNNLKDKSKKIKISQKIKKMKDE